MHDEAMKIEIWFGHVHYSGSASLFHDCQLLSPVLCAQPPTNVSGHPQRPLLPHRNIYYVMVITRTKVSQSIGFHFSGRGDLLRGIDGGDGEIDFYPRDHRRATTWGIKRTVTATRHDFPPVLVDRDLIGLSARCWCPDPVAMSLLSDRALSSFVRGREANGIGPIAV